MNRLTDKVFDYMTDFCDAKDCVNYEVDGCCSFERYRRLAAYEDTGLEPEEILSAVDMAKIACALHELNAYKDLGPIDHLRTLLQAEKDGRLSITPATVWHKGENGLHVVPYKPWMARWIGIRFWLSREEAEAVLASIDRKEGAANE